MARLSIVFSTIIIFNLGFLSVARSECPSDQGLQDEIKQLEADIAIIDDSNFVLNGGIPGLMAYGYVISPFLKATDYMLGPKFREYMYEQHQGLVEGIMIATIPLVVLPYTAVVNAQTAYGKVLKRNILKFRLSKLQKQLQECHA